LFETEYIIAGLAPFGEYLAILAYMEPTPDPNAKPNTVPAKEDMRLPELRIVTRGNEEISSDALEVHGFENCLASDYRLDHLATESLFYIVSPSDVVVAKPRDLDDHIRWLVDRQRYEEALAAAEAYPSFIIILFIV
jgi:vacuolar protein sorting-associated protein 41